MAIFISTLTVKYRCLSNGIAKDIKAFCPQSLIRGILFSALKISLGLVFQNKQQRGRQAARYRTA